MDAKHLHQEHCEYDVVLALAVFHHFIKTEEGFQQLEKLLPKLQMKEMYFLPHKPSERQMKKAYWNPSEDEFVAFILKHTKLSQATHIGYVEGRRSLYRLA